MHPDDAEPESMQQEQLSTHLVLAKAGTQFRTVVVGQSNYTKTKVGPRFREDEVWASCIKKNALQPQTPR
jgi:hypothetical protein